MLGGNFKLAQLELLLTAIVIDSGNFLLTKCQNQGIHVAVFWGGRPCEQNSADCLALKRTLLVIFRCRSRAGITFHTTDWRSTEECCACGPRFTLQFLQMLHFNCFLLCIWKRFFYILSENNMTAKCPVCLYAFPYWLHVLIFVFNYRPSVFADILQR